jgi:dynein heavy chain, axonemal
MQVKDQDSGQMVMDYWESAKKMMTDSGFLESLKSFDKDNIDPEIVKKLQPIISRDEFEPKKVLKVSKAAFGLASWVKAMDSYDRVAKVVRPKKAALAEAEDKLKVGTHVPQPTSSPQLNPVGHPYFRGN